MVQQAPHIWERVVQDSTQHRRGDVGNQLSPRGGGCCGIRHVEEVSYVLEGVERVEDLQECETTNKHTEGVVAMQK